MEEDERRYYQVLVDAVQEEHKAFVDNQTASKIPSVNAGPQRIGDLEGMLRFVKVNVGDAQNKGGNLLGSASLKDREDPVTKKLREASMARATKKREIVSKKREATVTRHKGQEQPPTQNNAVIAEQLEEDEEMKEVPPVPQKSLPSGPPPNPAPKTKKEVPRTLLQTKSPKPAQAV